MTPIIMILSIATSSIVVYNLMALSLLEHSIMTLLKDTQHRDT
jgi:hypothetical protein